MKMQKINLKPNKKQLKKISKLLRAMALPITLIAFSAILLIFRTNIENYLAKYQIQPEIQKAVTKQRYTSESENNCLVFAHDEEAYGWSIELMDGQSCSDGCYLTSSPNRGKVCDGVINPDEFAIPSDTKTWLPEPTKPEHINRRLANFYPGSKAPFRKGEEVYGWMIALNSGDQCRDNNCYLKSAPEAGFVVDGIINPLADELPTDLQIWKN